LLSSLEKWGSLSSAQNAYLTSIIHRYREEELTLEKQWVTNYSDEKRMIAERVALYYIDSGYFFPIASSVLKDPGSFVVPRKRWSKFCENKYAKKILLQYSQKPKFSKGDSIQIRSKNRVYRANYGVGGSPSYGATLANKSGIVLEADCKPITESFKGSRVYRILLSTEPKPIFAFESDLKKARYKKN